MPAADKVAFNQVGDFTTLTLAGEEFANEDLPSVACVAFLDPEDEGFADFYQALSDGAEGVRSAGADIVVCVKGDMDAQLFQDAPFSIVAYNEPMKEALAQNDEMASGIPCTGVWYVNGSLNPPGAPRWTGRRWRRAPAAMCLWARRAAARQRTAWRLLRWGERGNEEKFRSAAAGRGGPHRGGGAAGGARHGAAQGRQSVSGVCGHWLEKNEAEAAEDPAAGHVGLQSLSVQLL